MKYNWLDKYKENKEKCFQGLFLPPYNLLLHLQVNLSPVLLEKQNENKERLFQRQLTSVGFIAMPWAEWNSLETIKFPLNQDQVVQLKYNRTKNKIPMKRRVKSPFSLYPNLWTETKPFKSFYTVSEKRRNPFGFCL